MIGKTVHLDGRSVQIVGVMPASFRYPLNLRNTIYTPRLITDRGWKTAARTGCG